MACCGSRTGRRPRLAGPSLSYSSPSETVSRARRREPGHAAYAPAFAVYAAPALLAGARRRGLSAIPPIRPRLAGRRPVRSGSSFGDHGAVCGQLTDEGQLQSGLAGRLQQHPSVGLLPHQPCPAVSDGQPPHLFGPDMYLAAAWLLCQIGSAEFKRAESAVTHLVGGNMGIAARAYANTDDVVLVWQCDRIEGCLGFAVQRKDASGGPPSYLPTYMPF